MQGIVARVSEQPPAFQQWRRGPDHIARIGLMLLISLSGATASLAQYSYECNQLRGLERQVLRNFADARLSGEEENIAASCGYISIPTSIVNGKQFAENIQGCFLLACFASSSTSNCLQKASVVKDRFEISLTLDKARCPSVQKDLN